mgnify:CR=1 FL=1
MKTYKSSDLTHKRAEVLKAARENGVIIEERRSNGEVINEFFLVEREVCEFLRIGAHDFEDGYRD